MNQNLVVVEPVVEETAAPADGGFGIAEHIPGETEPGRDLDRRGIGEVLVDDSHALERGYAGSKLSDHGGRNLLAGHRIAAYAHTPGVAERLDQLRLLSPVIYSGVPRRELVA